MRALRTSDEMDGFPPAMMILMRIAAYVFYAIAVGVAAVGLYSVFVARVDYDVKGWWIVGLFAVGTAVAAMVGAGLHAMARERDDD